MIYKTPANPAKKVKYLIIAPIIATTDQKPFTTVQL